MNKLATFYQLFIGKKQGIQASRYGNYWNHPNRLESVKWSGSYTLTKDERNKPSPINGEIAEVFVTTVDLALLPTLSRVFQTDGLPSSDPAEGPIADNEFYLRHLPQTPWKFELTSNYYGSDMVVSTVANIGSTKRDFYQYSSASSSWALSSTLPDEDVNASWNLRIYDGGYLGFGGKDDDSPAKIRAILDATRIGTVTVDDERLPWVEPWASMTGFSSVMSARITDLNTAAGYALYSGTGSPSIDFVF